MPRRKPEQLPRVQQFVHEYVWGKHAGNVTRSAIAAGYGNGDENHARNYGCQLLRRKTVADLVTKEHAEKRSLFKQKAIDVAERTYLRAMADIGQAYQNGKLLDPDAMPDEIRLALHKIEVEERHEGEGEDAEVYYIHKIGLADPTANSTLFLKWAGDLREKVDVEHQHHLYVIDPYAEPPTKAQSRK